ncbi:putative membrane protein [Friedmanniella endophytica]|uniref:Putative membrane protein n=1 Tax=Microlunatus kandeliicorticis TaxID=1759536 RepID=A0A7W3IQR6_9ACTN|nr:YhgE/Pip domain-containing protein [Microlunatus kandeliicorticis]MBA8793526.1 putative membrane protein [Microlunatus kandeliicorticis]
MFSIERSRTTRKAGIITLLGVLLVPLLVAGGFLAATYHSQDRLARVQAAVVNLDDPVRLNGQLVPLGRQLAGGLVNGSDDIKKQAAVNFDWVLSDRANAASGLADGRYAAVVTIPKSFSADATSYAKNKADDAQRATLQVQTSQVAGVTDPAVAQAISSVAVSTLNKTLTQNYLENIYLGFNDTKKQFTTVANGAGKLADGATQLSSGLDQTATGAGKLADGMAQLSTGSSQLAGGIAQTSTGTTQLANGLDQLAAGTKSLPKQVGQLADGTQSSADGAKKLAGGLKKVDSGTAQYTQGVGTYVDNVGKLGSGISTYAGGLQTAQTEATKQAEQIQNAPDQALCAPAQISDPQQCAVFAAGFKAASQSIFGKDQISPKGQPDGVIASYRLFANGASVLGTNAGKLVSGGQQLATSGDGLASGVHQAATGTSSLATGLGKLAAGTDQLSTGLTGLSTGIAKTATGADKLATGVGKLSTGANQLAVGVSKSSAGVDQLHTGLVKLSDGGDQLADGTTKLADGLEKGAKQIPTYTKSDRTTLASVVAAPVEHQQPDSLFSDTTTTTLLALLALWLGGLVTYLVVRAVPSDVLGSAKSTVRLALEALAPGAAIGAVQAVVFSVVLQQLLDLSFGDYAATLGFLVFAAVTFAVVNHALTAWFGGFGRLLSALALAVVAAASLTSAVPSFIDDLRPVLPLSPGLDGLRAVVTGASGTGHAVAVLLGWLVVGLAASVVAVARRRVLPAQKLTALPA